MWSEEITFKILLWKTETMASYRVKDILISAQFKSMVSLYI